MYYAMYAIHNQNKSIIIKKLSLCTYVFMYLTVCKVDALCGFLLHSLKAT